MSATRTRDRRALAAGAVLVITLLAGARGVPAWREWDRAAREGAIRAEGEVARAREASRRLPALLDSIEARQGRVAALGEVVLDGDTFASAAASLVSMVSGAGAAAGVEVGALQVVPDTSDAGVFSRVRVRGEATGDLPGLLRVLRTLEGGPQLLVVRDWSVAQPDVGGSAGGPEALRMRFEVEGIALRGGKEDS
jgi:hypothetical protein